MSDPSTPGHPCQQIKDAIIKCIVNSECMKSGRTFHQCRKAEDLDQDCKDLLYTFFKCKIDMFDPRNRFRGNVAAQTWEKETKEKADIEIESNKDQQQKQ